MILQDFRKIENKKKNRKKEKKKGFILWPNIL